MLETSSESEPLPSKMPETACNPKEGHGKLGLLIILKGERSVWENESLMGLHLRSHFKLLMVKA